MILLFLVFCYDFNKNIEKEISEGEIKMRVKKMVDSMENESYSEFLFNFKKYYRSLGILDWLDYGLDSESGYFCKVLSNSYNDDFG